MFFIRFVCSLLLISIYQCSVIRVEDDKKTPDGLYKEDDKVLILSSEIFSENVFNKPYATEVEFYNSFCGYCRRFAPEWIEYAKNIHSWRDIVKVAAINCADETNADLCRTYEIMGYPTIRYFSPYLNETSTNLGINVKHVGMDTGHEHLMALLLNETIKPTSWPSFDPIALDNFDDLDRGLSNDVEYLFLLFDHNANSTIAQESALDVHTFKMVQVRQIVSPTIATNLKLSIENPFIVYDKKTKTSRTVVIDKLDRHSVTLAIFDYIAREGVRSPASNDVLNESVLSTTISIKKTSIKENDIIEHAKNNVGVVHQADLESALRYSVFHELVKINEMNDEQWNAIKRYVSVLRK